ncbi:aspartate kinase [Mucilaginibacter pedocola]|uniref:aspartate kinase n=1 Tax=Mucilaginibacter pedocola TaxID=1792845 RepID=A0A1S9PJ74_9SPHI|nr:aspartate kinase [Mucilaginibacter pedocola]OOQ60987.1 aspartate kinase [Mucilaginibacter pedocola]
MNNSTSADPLPGELTVEKIGGTSMTALDAVLQNIICYPQGKPVRYNRVFVVSAFSGVTDMLLENKKTDAPGVYHSFKHYRDFHRPLKKLVAALKAINKKYQALGLNLPLADAWLEDRISRARRYLENLAGILSSGYANKEGILQAAREILASIGEAHSAYNLTQILQNRGINAQLVDLSGLDDHQELTIDQRIRKAFKAIDTRGGICVVTGYAKGTEGIMREFDRGYSEVTFSKIAQVLKPKEAIIHKEYHLSTADPMLVGMHNCRPVGFTNYDIADQLADVGMEAIHPKAAKPLEAAGIALRIKNTFEPAHPGTLITRDHVSEHKRIEIITGTDKLLVIDVYDPKMVGSVGCDLLIMQLFDKHNISYTFKTTSANSISTVIWEKCYSRKLQHDLESAFEKVAVEPVALVCLLGSNMDRPGLLAKSSAALAASGINIKSVGAAFRKVNVQFLVDRHQYKPAIIALNQAMHQHSYADNTLLYEEV